MADLFNTLNPPKQHASEMPQTNQSSSPGQTPPLHQDQMFYRDEASSSRLRVKIFAVLAVMLFLIGLPLFLLANTLPHNVQQQAQTPNGNPTSSPTAGACSAPGAVTNLRISCLNCNN